MRKSGFKFIMALFTIMVFFSCSAEGNNREDVVFLVLEKGPTQYKYNYYIGMDKTIYLPADEVHAIQLFKTRVQYLEERKCYYPLFEKYAAPMKGTIEIVTSRGETTVIKPEPFTYGVTTLSDPAEIVTNRSQKIPEFKHIYFGAEAGKASDDYEKKLKEYEAARDVYNREAEKYNKRIQEITAQADKLHKEFLHLKEQNKDTTRVMQQMNDLLAFKKEPPVEPEKPEEQIMQKVDAYRFDLPEGTCSLRMRDADNRIIEGTEKKLVCFKASGEITAGYQVIPHQKWDNFYNYSSSHSVVYTDGSQNLFVRPYLQERYPGGMFNQVKDPQYINQLIEWKRIGYPVDFSLEVSGEGKTVKIASVKMTAVRNRDGMDISIMPMHEAAGNGSEIPKNADPVFLVELPLKNKTGVYSIRLFDSNTAPVDGSDRQIHVVGKVDPPGMIVLSIITGFLPLLIWLSIKMFVKIQDTDEKNK